MKIYSKAEWAREQYKGRWEASPFNLDRVEAGDLSASYIGRRNVMVGGIHGCTLLTEGINFLVDGEYEELPWLEKSNAHVGHCYRMPGGYIEVTKVYRITEEYAKEHDLYHMDRVEYIQHAKWGTVHGGCALAGSDIRKN